MSPLVEKRALQAAMAIACLVPLLAGGAGVLRGAAFLHGTPHPVPADLDSHLRYLSGIFLGVGIAFCTCVPTVERKTARFRLLGTLAILGGLARALSALEIGLPSAPHRFGLAMELVAVPLLLLWQARVARRIAPRPRP